MTDEDVTPPTQTFGDLTPPPPKPPVAVSADAAGPEPRPPRPWPIRRRDVPNPVAQGIDSALDALDKLGDAIRSVTRLA